MSDVTRANQRLGCGRFTFRRPAGYLGRTASFVLEADGSGADEVEQRIGALADEFVAQKPHLRERWRDS